MINELLNQMIGLQSSKLLGLYFKNSEGIISQPTSIVMPQKHGASLEIEADGHGGVQIGSAVFDRLFFDAERGFSFIAPLTLAVEGAFNGTECIEHVSLQEAEKSSIISFDLEDNRTIKVQFEDDKMSVSLANLKE